MYRLIRRLFRDLPPLPDTLEQDLRNPLQRDRLPDTRSIELDFPAVAGSLEENRRLAKRWLAYAFVLTFVVAVFEFIVARIAFESMINYGAAFGFVLVWVSYLAVRKPPFRRLLLWVVTPHVVLALCLITDPTLSWIVAGLLAVFVADLFATHYLHLQTTAPMDRQRALGLRRLWRHRFGLIRAIKGNEFYFLAPLVIIAAVFGYIAADWLSPPDYALRNLYRFVVVVAGILAATFLIEFVAAFLFARWLLHPIAMYRHLWTAVVHWLTYNRTSIDAPGAYQTPAGSYRHRRRMAWGLVVLFAATVPQFVSPARDLELISQARHPVYGDSWGDPETTDDNEQLLQNGEQPKMVADDLPTSQAPQLEVYQQRMLERMSNEQREAYLADLYENEAGAPSAEETIETDVAPNDGTFGMSRFLPQRLAHALATIYMFLALLIVPLLCAAASMTLLLAFAFATTGRLAARFGPTTSVAPEDLLTAERWKELVARVQSSKDKTEQESLLLGVNNADNTPVLVPRSVFAEHAHLLGDSGSGKTSIGIASILSQLIRCKQCSVVVLDLKGDDLAMFEGVRQEAKDAGLRFRWFTNQLEHSTYAFNPLLQQPLKRMTLYQKVDMLTTAMGLQYGRDYGRAYYSDANARMLHALLAQHGDIESFERMADILDDVNGLQGVDRELRQAGAHLGAIVNRLADTEAINVVPDNGLPQSVVDASIEFTDVFRTPQVIQFHLTSTIGTTSAAEMARIALYSLITAATAVPPKERVQTFVVIDEFQRIIAGNIEMLLQLARSLNIGIILANQSLMDLKTAGIDLIPAISANTRFRQIFAASNLEEQERISRGSGESLTYTQAWQEYIGTFFTALADGRKLTEYITPRLRMNDILLATDHPLQSIVQIRRGSGYAQYGGMPFVMRSTHQITYKEYTERKDAQWPEASEETLVPQIRQQPRRRGERSGWFGEQDVFVDEQQSVKSAGHFLDQLYQQQKAASQGTALTEGDHSDIQENPHD